MALRQRQTELTQETILEAGTRLFFDGSTSESTMQAIAETAGVSERTLYRHFPSRRELTNAVGRYVDEQLEGARHDLQISSFDEWIASIEAVAGLGDRLAAEGATRRFEDEQLVTVDGTAETDTVHE